ncbi:MAG: hypothetical protein C0622_09795 [Desulfuromonas sp.]|nr:MAG: hypothetical protein C0622_09795 [Desulfuromonas sp.]
MYKAKFEDNVMLIGLSDPVQKTLAAMKFNHVELFRLIENFAQNLLGEKQSGAVRLENQDTKAVIDLDISWNTEAKEVTLIITGINLAEAKPEDLNTQPTGPTIDFNKFLEEEMGVPSGTGGIPIPSFPCEQK